MHSGKGRKMKNTENRMAKLSFVTAAAVLTLSSSFAVSAQAQTADGKQLAVLPVAYMVTTAIAFLFLIGYCALVKNRKYTFVLLFASVFVVTVGYAFLALSKTLPEALLANRISYLGAVFLPLFMLLIIMEECRIKCTKLILAVLISISVTVFFIAATPGYGTLYYKDVTLIFVNGGAKLVKTYGPLHKVYYIYLALYFVLMIAVIMISYIRNRHKSPKLVINLLTLVLGNIMVWLIEQLIRFDFEFLAISYIVTEMYLLSLYNMADEFRHRENDLSHTAERERECEAETDRDVFGFIYDQDDIPEIKDIIRIWPAVAQLTTRETEVFCQMLMNRKRREIADDLCVSENTIKKHTSNIFTKLGVSSRAEIIRLLSVKNH